MKLHDLHPAEGSHRRKRRVGRGHGSGRGKTAGRGTKGQLARSGGGWNPRFEGGQTPIHLRIPHRRGFKNPFRVEYEIVKLGDLERLEAGSTVTRAVLEAARLLRPNDPRPVKILATGELTKALHFDGVHASASARAKVEAAGGSFAGIPTPDTAAGEPDTDA
jgi:large subunit ribosomal protein L15